tara:strand:- start:1057 stop:1464 length:408 start_codon:yes stop_codon:yes gene_type:complete
MFNENTQGWDVDILDVKKKIANVAFNISDKPQEIKLAPQYIQSWRTINAKLIEEVKHIGEWSESERLALDTVKEMISLLECGTSVFVLNKHLNTLRSADNTFYSGFISDDACLIINDAAYRRQHTVVDFYNELYG